MNNRSSSSSSYLADSSCARFEELLIDRPNFTARLQSRFVKMATPGLRREINGLSPSGREDLAAGLNGLVVELSMLPLRPLWQTIRDLLVSLGRVVEVSSEFVDTDSREALLSIALGCYRSTWQEAATPRGIRPCLPPLADEYAGELDDVIGSLEGCPWNKHESIRQVFEQAARWVECLQADSLLDGSADPVIGVPVMIDSTGTGALYFMRGFKLKNTSLWNLDWLPSGQRGYAGLLAERAVAAVRKKKWREDRFQNEAELLKSSYGFGLLYNAEIEKGFSYSGALFVLLAACYYRQRYPLKKIRIQHCSISVAVNDDGTTSKVDGICSKIRAHNDWNPDLPIYLPESNREAVAALVKDAQLTCDEIRNIRFVSDTQELLDGVLEMKCNRPRALRLCIIVFLVLLGIVVAMQRPNSAANEMKILEAEDALGCKASDKMPRSNARGGETLYLRKPQASATFTVQSLRKMKKPGLRVRYSNDDTGKGDELEIRVNSVLAGKLNTKNTRTGNVDGWNNFFESAPVALKVANAGGDDKIEIVLSSSDGYGVEIDAIALVEMAGHSGKWPSMAEKPQIASVSKACRASYSKGTLTIQGESLKTKTGRCETRWRDKAQGERTLYLTSKGTTVVGTLDAEQAITGAVLTIRYSNDDSSKGDVLIVFVDSKEIGRFKSKSTHLPGGAGWNNFVTSPSIAIGNLKPGVKCNISIRLEKTDQYGIEIDSISITSRPKTEKQP